MIDPKMLELSIYDGIPHLLTPVVTDPKKAVVALKWTVREMEDRYRKMSKLGVRNIDGYNARLAQAAGQGRDAHPHRADRLRPRDRRGDLRDRRSSSLEPMPFIVVIIDEMADLMMVAGKDIEGAVQRLAQMARAAGIHVIMATQRPSVDVITGTIKANFPTRISFQVTSKIDSRTILGEQGAEQLLGQGDMLYMAGGGRITARPRPLRHRRGSRGGRRPPEGAGRAGLSRRRSPSTTRTRRRRGLRRRSAAAARNRTTSTTRPSPSCSATARPRPATSSAASPIGYNRAASIIERMEKEGVVGPANHAGKREILVPEDEEAGFR